MAGGAGEGPQGLRARAVGAACRAGTSARGAVLTQQLVNKKDANSKAVAVRRKSLTKMNGMPGGGGGGGPVSGR